MTTGYQDIIWLAGRVFLKRDFVSEYDDKGLDKLFEECPYGDLTDEQRTAFKMCFTNATLRKAVAEWWVAYDVAKSAGEIPSVKATWEP